MAVKPRSIRAGDAAPMDGARPMPHRMRPAPATAIDRLLGSERHGR